MAQFLIGFWCGCVAATLVLCLLFANKIRQWKEIAAREEDYRESPKEALSAGEPVTTDTRVLVVDDSRLSRTVIRDILLKRNLEVHEAENGMESLKLVKKYTFDLIFIDQHMPGLDGDETLLRLKNEGGVGKEVPVVAVGSVVRKEHEPEFREKGYAACLGKPIQENRVDEILAAVLPNKEKEGLCRDEEKEEALRGFSYRKGLDNFDGNEEGYRETLCLFAELWIERKAQLQQFLNEENMPEYAILIHAIKGDARTLGAELLGEMAYEQELQAKAGEIAAVRAGFNRVVEEGDKTAGYFMQMFS